MMKIIAKSGGRADKIIAAHLPEVSRTKICRLLNGGLIKVNDEVISPSGKVRAGDKIAVPKGAIENRKCKIQAKDMNLEVVFENDDFAVIDKPPFLKVHPINEEDRTDSLINGLMNCFKKLSGVNGPLRPGIVHRLDKDTSGLLIVAKNDETHTELATLFKKRRINKTYLTLLHGEIEPSEGTIKAPIARSKKGQLMKVSSDGKMAVTKYKVLKFIDGLSYVEVKLITGRTHQIRVHFSKMGYAVVGDEHYSSAKQQKFAKENDVTRLFLHCSELKFKLKGESYNLKAPIPNDLETVLTAFSEK